MNKIKKYWSVKNFPLIILVSLYVAVFFTFHPIEFPATTLAYEAQKEVELTPEALLEKYKQEEIIKMDKEAEIRATRRLFDELGVVVENLNPSK